MDDCIKAHVYVSRSFRVVDGEVEDCGTIFFRSMQEYMEIKKQLEAGATKKKRNYCTCPIFLMAHVQKKDWRSFLAGKHLDPRGVKFSKIAERKIQRLSHNVDVCGRAA